MFLSPKLVALPCISGRYRCVPGCMLSLPWLPRTPDMCRKAFCATPALLLLPCCYCSPEGLPIPRRIHWPRDWVKSLETCIEHVEEEQIISMGPLKKKPEQEKSGHHSDLGVRTQAMESERCVISFCGQNH